MVKPEIVTLWPCHLHLKSILRPKEEGLWKFKYFTMQKYINLQKNPLKETKKSFNIS
jgi:hypothetical protein